MKIIITTDKVTREQVLKRIFFMLYMVCGSPFGMGVLRAINNATEEDVWENVTRGADYPGDRGATEFAQGRIRGDYVFGRMMKWGVKLTEDAKAFTVLDNPFNSEYQGFSGTYPDNKSIFDAVMKDLGVEGCYEIVEEK